MSVPHRFGSGRCVTSPVSEAAGDVCRTRIGEAPPLVSGVGERHVGSGCPRWRNTAARCPAGGGDVIVFPSASVSLYSNAKDGIAIGPLAPLIFVMT